ncbi:MAG: hypothetical protein KJ658_05205 [Proteobacteria bacterium]|nr:hypothetical protein [Desulfobacula sp.]MBU3951516.1 hypothetical protein [Pseudomonadota bacterium]
MISDFIDKTNERMMADLMYIALEGKLIKADPNYDPDDGLEFSKYYCKVDQLLAWNQKEIREDYENDYNYFVDSTIELFKNISLWKDEKVRKAWGDDHDSFMAMTLSIDKEKDGF